MEEEKYSRGEIARLTGIGYEALRHYERMGILKELGRDRNGYRAYGPEELRDLRIARKMQALGYSLREIEGFIDGLRRKDKTEGELAQAIDEKIKEIEADIGRLEEVKAELLRIRGEDGKPRCPSAGY